MDTILPGNVFTISNGLLVQEPLHKKDTDDSKLINERGWRVRALHI